MATSTAHTGETQQGEGLKETVESIVVALILAFIFRAFVVEAFVIPTGSMAPTLYGAHGTIICEDCGTEFAYGLKDSSDTRNIAPVGSRAEATCPNCRHRNTNLKLSDERRNAESGDRILVFKWPNDLGGALLGPARWDVTVFKNPANGVENYIKRLVGLPGEVLMILDGDIYTVPTEALSPETLKELELLRHEKYEYRKGIRRGRLRRMSKAALEELEQKLTVARKTVAAQRILWFPVYDHDYPPRSLDKRKQPYWHPTLGEASGWVTSSRRLRFEDRGSEADFIELAGTDIRATYAYNIARAQRASMTPPVSDQRVRFVFSPGSPESIVRVRLVKSGRVFWATIGADGLVSITESRDIPAESTLPLLERRLRPLSGGRPVEISFENVDYRLALHVGGKEVLATSDDRDAPSYYGPDVASLLRRRKDAAAKPPRIYAERGNLELSHLAVEHDVFYYDPPPPVPTQWARKGWGTAGNPILLRPGEYFMLGDNSAASQDSRLWGTVGPHLEVRDEAFQLGTVPEDQLIGKAFFVYWPSGHRLEWLPFLKWGIIPDVGRMRWIR